MLDVWEGLWPNCVACICNEWLHSICWESWDNTENQGSGWSLRSSSFDQPVRRYKNADFQRCWWVAALSMLVRGGGVGRTPTLLFLSLMLFSASFSLSRSLVNWTGEGQTDRYRDRQSNGQAKTEIPMLEEENGEAKSNCQLHRRSHGNNTYG